jgi:hypothetical protein
LKIGFFGRGIPNYMTDDAQAMALVKKFDLSISRGGQAIDDPWWRVTPPFNARKGVSNTDINRAICECVARLP